MQLHLPRRLTVEEMEREAGVALHTFVQERLAEGTSSYAAAKADLAVRLLDGRLLAIECKVSNSAINSVKRLNRETAGKAGQWRDGYGKQVVSAAVLSGVFKVGNLVDAQTAGVHIFWDHDLSSLRTYIQETCQS